MQPSLLNNFLVTHYFEPAPPTFVLLHQLFVPLPLPSWNRMLFIHRMTRKDVNLFIHQAARFACESLVGAMEDIPERFEWPECTRKNKWWTRKEFVKTYTKKVLGWKKDIPPNAGTWAEIYRVPSGKLHIHVHSVAPRLHDSEGISTKAFVDGLVKAQLMQDDSREFLQAVTHSEELIQAPPSVRTRPKRSSRRRQ